jgi:hypothetical protein
MKVLLPLILIVGFGFWLTQEIQHEKELESKLDETRQALDDANKQLQALQSQSQQNRAQQRVGGNAQWSNPLDAAPVRSYGHK